jgi:SulP family sulfate permease
LETTAHSWFRPALLGTLRRGYPRRDLVQDLLAGLLVGVVALPLSMGLAIASGCEPQRGLYTAIIGGLIVSLIGGSRVQIAGPAGAFVGLCAGCVATYGYDGLAVATLMAGALIVLLGALRLGRAITFVPVPVVIGFTTGIAVIIASTQLSPALGIAEPRPAPEHVHERLGHLIAHLGEARWQPLAACAATMAIIVTLRRLSPKLPGPIIALTIVGTLAWALQLDAQTIGGAFPQFGAAHSLPAPRLPDFHLTEATLGSFLTRMQQLSGYAFAIALLGSIESLLSAVVADGLAGDRHDSNTELIAQGTANLISPLFGGLPVTGVIARTSTNIRAGARTPVAGITHSLTVLAALLALASVVAHVPLACLAGILLMVCWYMAELRHWPHVLKAGRGDAFLLPLAFLLTVFVGLQWAVPIGVLLAMLFFVKRMSELTRIERGATERIGGGHAEVPAGIEVYEINGPFFFGAATLLRDLDHELNRRPTAMILRLRHVPFIDGTAAFGLRELVHSCRAKGIAFKLCEVHRHAARDLERHGLVDLIGRDHVLDTLDGAIAAAAAPRVASAAT